MVSSCDYLLIEKAIELLYFDGRFSLSLAVFG